MIDPKKYVIYFMSLLIRAIGFIPATIYGYVYSEFFTKATYFEIGQRNQNKQEVKNVLDIGTATGQPLKSIIDNFKDASVVGIDYNPMYINSCKKLFEEHSNVEIKCMNFYDLEKKYAEVQFDIIIFGSSFMILPDQAKAIEIAKRKLTPNGKIYFLQTLYDEKNSFNKFMEIVKPCLKYISTVDFGKVTYKTDFEKFLSKNGLKTNMHGRCKGNFWLKYFKFYIYQTEKVNSQETEANTIRQVK